MYMYITGTTNWANFKIPQVSIFFDGFTSSDWLSDW